jgi:hypothetical protein
MDTGASPITDLAELTRVRGQARAVHLKSLILAIVLTVSAILI